MDLKGWEKLFPVAQMLMCIGAALIYMGVGDWRRFTYWLAAAVLTASVTF